MSVLKTLPIHLLLAATIFHLAACSSPTLQSFLNNTPTTQQDTLLNDHQTHKLINQWHKLNYSTHLPNQKITFTNKHPHAPQFYKLFSGFHIQPIAIRTKGIGLPVVVQTHKAKFTPITQKAYQANVYPATIVAVKSPNGDLQITLLDPRHDKTHHGQPLITQNNIVIDHITNDPNNKRLSIRGLLKPLEYQQIQGLYLSQKYDKKKIPIVMIHGIFSSPETFMPMAEAIDAQPDLHSKYQIWHYYYPTGAPWISTAQQFRSSFRKLIKTLDPQATHQNLRKTTIIAHSMGGLITRLSLSHPKNTLTEAYLGDQGAQILNQTQRKTLEPIFHYTPLTEPEQVIFMAVPHRGSEMASGLIGWITKKIITIPNILIQGTVGILLPQQQSKLSKHTVRLLTKGENSVYQLQPDNPALQAMNQMVLPKHIKVHSIIGDLGPRGIKLYTDGVVTYKSSHLNGRGTETIVPSSHEVTAKPKSIKRVIQILRKK